MQFILLGVLVCADLVGRCISAPILDSGLFHLHFHFIPHITAVYPAFFKRHQTEQNGCKEILKAIDKMTLPDGLNLQNEVQLGKNKLFIRTPEMYFAIEQLRERQFEK